LNDTATTEIYTACYTLSLHDALPIGVTEGPPPTLFGRRPVYRLLHPQTFEMKKKRSA
jgi:hypothetical protein